MAGRGGPYIATGANTALAASGTLTVTLSVNGDYLLRRIELVVDGTTDATSRDATISITSGQAVQDIVSDMAIDVFFPINILEATGSIVEAGVGIFDTVGFKFSVWRTLAIPFRDQCQVKFKNGAGATTNVVVYAECTPRDSV